MQRVIIVGGTGRIGGALGRRLAGERPDLHVVLAGRRGTVGEKLAKEIGEQCSFKALEIHDEDPLREALRGADLVVNCAGPFQQAEPLVLAAALDAGVPYLDIADDLAFSRRAKELHARAVGRRIPAVVNGGLFPGLSNVIAGLLVERAAGAERVDFSYFVAGTGGAGPAVMASTFLLAALPATEFVDGHPVGRKAFTGKRVVEFPAPVGRRATFYIELPEVSTCAETYRVPNVSARFGTAPGIWNTNTRAIASLPRSWVGDRRRVAGMVSVLMPMLRAVDWFVGAAAAMRVDVVGRVGQERTIAWAHPETVPAIATAIAAQAGELLDGRVAPGVWWPEEAIKDKEAHIRRASEGASLILPED